VSKCNSHDDDDDDDDVDTNGSKLQLNSLSQNRIQG
jgi:hypothetical protein